MCEHLHPLALSKYVCIAPDTRQRWHTTQDLWSLFVKVLWTRLDKMLHTQMKLGGLKIGPQSRQSIIIFPGKMVICGVSSIFRRTQVSLEDATEPYWACISVKTLSPRVYKGKCAPATTQLRFFSSQQLQQQGPPDLGDGWFG